MYAWFVVLPPLIVLLCACITKRVVLSLALGIVGAAFIAGGGNIGGACILLLQRVGEQLELANMFIFIFLVNLGVIITMISHTGGTAAYSSYMRQKVKNARAAQYASLLLSCCFLIDDFFSSITVGCIMRPITDHFLIPRAKLAFLIDAMAAPLVILVPFSSWIAMITAQLSKAGIALEPGQASTIIADPFIMYVRIIPFIFYSFLMFASVIFIVWYGISWGPMHTQEVIAATTGNLFGGKEPLAHRLNQLTTQEGSLADFIVPMASLILGVLGAGLYAGNYVLLGGGNSLLQALQQTDIFFALFLGSSISLVISVLFFTMKNRRFGVQLPILFYEGYTLMSSSILVLFLAWTFSGFLIKDLMTGHYIAHLLVGHVGLVWFPALFFIVSVVISISIGSSWGTIAVMVPLVVPMVLTFLHITVPVDPSAVPILYPLLGAVFAGAVAGDHISPIASTTVMSSTSAGCYHADHVYTQFLYALPALGASVVAFLLSGLLVHYPMWLNVCVSLGGGAIICLSLLWLLNYNRELSRQKANL